VPRDTSSRRAGLIQFAVSQGVSYYIEVSATTLGGAGLLALTVSMTAAVPSVTLSPQSTNLVAGQRQQFTANVTGSANTAVRWTISPPLGTISSTGQYTAPIGLTSAQTVRVTAVSFANSAIQASATIALNPANITFSADSITNAATFRTGGVSPGEIVTIFGAGMGPASLAGAVLTADGTKLSTNVGGTQVLFDGIPAPVVYTQAGQVSVIVPYEVAGEDSTQVQVKYNGQASPTVPVPVVRSVPGLFTALSSGSGQAAMLNQDGSVNSMSNPAAPGSIVVLFGTGEGQTNPAGIDGLLSASVYPGLTLPISVRIGGINAAIRYSGEAPSLVAGVFQINVVVPLNAPTSDQVPVVVTIGGVNSRSDVTMSVALQTGPPQ
jgi:uncharacterized protein (TIGR03437 family)